MAQIDDAIQERTRQAERAREDGDADALAAHLQELATLQLGAQRLDEARASLKEALKLRTDAGHPEAIAQVRYALSLLDNLQGRGAQGLEASLAEFERLGDVARQIAIHKRLAARAMGEARWARCEEHLEALERLAAESGDDATTREVLQMRAFLSQSRGQTEEAMELLKRAMASAAEAGATGELNALRWTQAALGASSAEELELAARESEAHGDHRAAAYLRLQRAGLLSLEGRHQEALSIAEEARQVALQSVDPTLYLMSSIGIAHVQELRREDVAVLTTLYTCRATLADLLGPGGGDMVLFLVRACHTRWGDARFAKARDGYRAQFN